MLTAEYPPFRPMPGFRNAHAQTVGAFLFPGKRSVYRAEKHLVQLRDGDRIVIHDDRPKAWITGDRMAIMVHGLCGCHNSPYMCRVSEKLRRNGIRTIRVDMRGFGASTLISKSHVHAGSSADLQDVVAYVTRLSPLSKLSLVGFSLGGNIVLKALGEWDDFFPREIDSAISVSAPVDLVRSSANLRHNGNRFYDHYFMRQLKGQLFLRRRKVAQLVDNGLNPIPDRLLEFDDQFVAPVAGFSSAREYYERSASGPLLKSIRVPTILLIAKDDPIAPFSSYQQFELSDSVELIATRYGGHLGFLSRGLRDPNKYWMDWRISQWIASLDDQF